MKVAFSDSKPWRGWGCGVRTCRVGGGEGIGKRRCMAAGHPALRAQLTHTYPFSSACPDSAPQSVHTRPQCPIRAPRRSTHRVDSVGATADGGRDDRGNVQVGLRAGRLTDAHRLVGELRAGQAQQAAAVSYRAPGAACWVNCIGSVGGVGSDWAWGLIPACLAPAVCQGVEWAAECPWSNTHVNTV